MGKRDKMFSLVERWRDSGLSREVFSQQNDIKVSTLAYWISKKKEVEMAASGRFVRLQPPSFDSGYEITYPNGVKLCVKSADLATLSQLLKL